MQASYIDPWRIVVHTMPYLLKLLHSPTTFHIR